ncbi:MAG TPA: FAD-dependent thymidylate synthase [Spirochaetia bacterium]|nr:FAD-dependent thymidylate synthase [Spirochaetia bacterium]HRZ65799.1 FAD-dependent thymidylate synthase [Spirochaetia bacterium]
MPHCVVDAAEEILDRQFPVLDKGFVRLVDYLGGDARIVQAARVSYGAGTKSYREDAALIDHLLRNEHTSPFEQVVLTFHVKLPIFVARQWIRHRTARVNEISGRYSVMKDEFYLPRPGDVALQSEDNKQGRAPGPAPEGLAESAIARLEAGQRAAYADYSALVDSGLARELARIDLPVSLYTEWYWQIDLHNLFRFLELRLDAHAQLEIREYARAILGIARRVAPAACASFENHRLGGLRLSAQELAELRRRLGSPNAPTDAAPLEGKALERFEEKLRSGRQL